MSKGYDWRNLGRDLLLATGGGFQGRDQGRRGKPQARRKEPQGKAPRKPRAW